MKITQFWDRFYHLESVPHIKCQKIWCQVSGYGEYKLEIPETRNLTPGIYSFPENVFGCVIGRKYTKGIISSLYPCQKHFLKSYKKYAAEQNSEDFSGQFCDNIHHPRLNPLMTDYLLNK